MIRNIYGEGDSVNIPLVWYNVDEILFRNLYFYMSGGEKSWD